jgi:phosphoserine phosphatase
MSQTKLPSWRPGPTRDAIEIFLDAAEMLPVEQRVAVMDVDGTLWCEQPRSPMLEFLLAELRQAATEEPAIAERPEYQAALEWDRAAISRLGAVNVVLALIELHAGLSPEAFEVRAREHFATARHSERGVPLSQTRYRPMLELIGELRARDFSVYLVTGSGLEFVRTVSNDLFGVSTEGVLGAQVGYELAREEGVPVLLRTREVIGDPNEGAAKIANIQRLLGRRPILAAGNSTGDAEMLEYTATTAGPSLALLVRHDDAEREYAYDGGQARDGWAVASMRDDWSTIFADT